MDLFYFLAGGFVILIFVLRMELLVQKEHFRIVLVLSVASSIVGLFLHFSETEVRYPSYAALFNPLLSLGLFRLYHWVFLRRFNREPKDTFWNWQVGLAADRPFSIGYFMTAGLIWMMVPVLVGLAKRA